SPGTRFATRMRRKAESVCAQHRATVQDGPIANMYTVVQRDSGVQKTVRSDRRTCPHNATRPDTRALANAGAVFNHTVRTNADALGYLGRLCNDRSGMNSFGQTLDTVLVKPLSQQGVHQIRLTAKHDPEWHRLSFEGFPGFGSQDDRGRATMLQLVLKAWSRQKADLAWPCAK